jgi:transcriptional regulator with PAS, ATPase and Fis domain
LIEAIKSRIWEQLQDKEVSLAMIVDQEGRILWHRGRAVQGNTLACGEGFSRSLLCEAIHSDASLREQDVMLSAGEDALPHSAKLLFLRCVLVLPLGHGLFLYLDSGSRDTFGEPECAVFETLGSLLREFLDGSLNAEGTATGLCGKSQAMETIRNLIVRYAVEEEAVLLTGETGVGKNRIAEAIHRCSGRKGAFVTINAPGVPEALFESEFFGHAKGAFTGAAREKPGMVDTAGGGTLFLDEIGELPPTFQAKLLQFLDHHTYRRVGDAKERKADVRIIAATNRILEEEVRANRFRQDLYYRLNVLPLAIPPLRERTEDLEDFVKVHASLLRGKRLAPGFWKAMRSHDWPGNVRELIHVLTRAGIQLDGAEIGAEIGSLIQGKETACAGTSPSSIQDQVRAEVAQGRSFFEAAWDRFLERELNREQLHALLVQWHRECGGNLKALANHLHIDDRAYPRFINLLHRYRVHPEK